MEPHQGIEIVDKDGWRKLYPIEKTLLHIGSDLGNDIVLDNWRGEGVSSRHLQLIATPVDRNQLRLVNLGETEVYLASQGNQPVPPRSAIDLMNGVRIQVGDFSLLFRLNGASANGTGRVRLGVGAIGLRLSMPETQLMPDHPLEARVTVRNQGEETGVQFKLEVDGVPDDMYELGPAPILFPGAEKQLPLRIFHPRRATPPAGKLHVSVRATAPEAYPGESANASSVITICPYYKHTLRLVGLK